MRSSQFFIKTLKEVPSEAKLTSHILMLKAGLIKKITSGIYIWLPLGLRILKKVENIVRQEMDNSGAIELLLPMVHPAEIWQESGRWDFYGKDLLRFKDRHNRDFCLAPTQEELITDLFRENISSYKQLPINFYQIQAKFRDEIRPRFGVMRAREFIMKDAYSFHVDKESLNATYEQMYKTYSNIFNKLGLIYKVVKADSGNIGGNKSHEFQALANNGEDTIAYSDSSDYAANIEHAGTLRLTKQRNLSKENLEKIATPGVKSIEDLVNFLKIPIEKTIKSIVIEGENNQLILILLRGDHTLNFVKLSKLDKVKIPIRLADEKKINKIFKAKSGFLGPVNFNGIIYADYAIEKDNDFVIGANETGFHFKGFNFSKKDENTKFVDIRNIEEGDDCEDGKGKIKLTRGIEIGHIFQIGNKYTKSMNVSLLNKDNKKVFLEMGCYGLGVTRVIAAFIEQNNDDKGIIWNNTLSPFKVIIIPINYHKNNIVKNKSNEIYENLKNNNVEVIIEDRNERSGVLLNDCELIGYPNIIIIGEKSLKNNQVEYKQRNSNKLEFININEIIKFIKNKINEQI